MNTRRIASAAIVAAVAVFGSIAAGGMAQADPPGPGDPCPALHATTTDAEGQTMWCNPMMTGTHGLVWQYGGPA
ncbi:hypothetical protein H7K24_12315 [Mycobacterium fragae]|uniref:hypothetical protein n=1 Tax=Mycobacterium fragae TaxID=1260918 RepID=UPI000A169A12|nr:hypothetical protein [Mycobacterium fragae]MCV7400937.1 hypothetical protein [Mycobacterium fragae]